MTDKARQTRKWHQQGNYGPSQRSHNCLHPFPFSESNPAIDRYFPTICIATSMESSLMPPSNFKVELKMPSPWFEVGRKTLRVFAACPRPLGYRRHSHDALQTLDPVRNAPCAASKSTGYECRWSQQATLNKRPGPVIENPPLGNARRILLPCDWRVGRVGKSRET